MSEPTPPAREPQRKGVKGALTRKIGPLPAWVWIVIVAAIILAWVVYSSRKKGKQQAGGIRAGAGQVPQFVNQTFTSPGPPPAPDQDNDEDEDRDRDHDGRPHPKPPQPRPVPLPGGKGEPPPTVGPPGRRHRRRFPRPVAA